MVKIVISGSKGKMGSRILDLAKEDKDIDISGAFDIGEDPSDMVSVCDCMIEFTSPKATIEHLELCENSGKAFVVGTTGLTAQELARIKEASKKIPIVLSPNMSVGVNVLFKMVADAARVLGHDYHVEIIEAHHVHKKDSPSGTAKEIAGIVKSLKGHTDVPIESIREDEIVGEHTVTFESPLDIIELTHSAKSRDIFAKGAIQAAKWITGKKAGLYSMKDVLGL